MNILAQCFGIAGMLFLMLSIQNNKKSNILIFQIFANIFYGFQYITLGLFSAGLMSVVSLARCFIFYHYEDKKNMQTPIGWLIALSTVTIGISFFTYTNVLSLIPIIATLLYTYAIWQKDLGKFRMIVTSSSIGWIVYNGLGGAYVSLIGSFFELVNGIIAITRFDIKKQKVAVK